MFRLVRQLREEIDREAFGTFVLSMTRERERRSRRLPARQDGRTLRRHGRRRELHAAHRAAVRDDRRPPARARDHEGAAQRPAGAPERAGAGRGAGGDDRLLRLQQGRRLPRVQLGAVQGADQADPGRPRGRGSDRVLPRPRRLGEPGRCADRPRDRGAAGRIGRRTDADHRAGRGRLVQVRQPRHRAVPDRAAGRERRGAHAQVRARGGAGPDGRRRRGDGGAVRRGAWRRTGG